MEKFDFGREVYCGETQSIERDGFTLTATIYADDDSDPPWEREDGHGAVSDWRRAGYSGHVSKQPGERPLVKDRGAARFYDFAGAVKLALKDGWGAAGDDGMKRRQKAAHAAEADFQRLRRWCEDDWRYIGVSVTVERAGAELAQEYECALWGIESDCGPYISEVAEELAGEALELAQSRIAELDESVTQ